MKGIRRRIRTISWRKLPWELRYRWGARLASEVRRVLILATHRHCTVVFEGPVNLGPGFRLNIPDNGSFVVGPGVDFRRGFYCEISGNGRVRIGGGTTFTGETMIQCSTSVEIAELCSFGQSTLIVDGNHDFRNPDKPWWTLPDLHRPIVIGTAATVLTKSTVLDSIGERALVAAHAVVSRPVPPYCMAGGAPAKILDYFGDPENRPEELEAR